MATAKRQDSEIRKLQARVTDLEKQLAELRDQLAQRSSEGQKPWWEKIIGTRANDPAFEEIVREGRKYRQTYRTDYEATRSRSKGTAGASKRSQKSRKAS